VHALPIHGQPRRDEWPEILQGRAGAGDLKTLVSPVASAEIIPTEGGQVFEHAGGTADREIALLTQG
jgi:hypothetical protein